MDDFGNEIKFVILTGWPFAMLARYRHLIDGGKDMGDELYDDELRFYGLIA